MDIKKYAPLLNGLAVVLVFSLFHFFTQYQVKRAEFRTFEIWVDSEVQLYIRLDACKKSDDQLACLDRELSYFKKNVDELVESVEKEDPDDRMKSAIARYRALESAKQ